MQLLYCHKENYGSLNVWADKTCFCRLSVSQYLLVLLLWRRERESNCYMAHQKEPVK